VYEGDVFDWAYGSERYLKHKPDFGVDRTDENIIASYAGVDLHGGGQQFFVCPRVEIDKARARSMASASGPWVTDYAAMARKTAVRRLYPLLPASPEMLKAAWLEDTHEAGERQDLGAMVDVPHEVMASDPNAASEGEDGAPRTLDDLIPPPVAETPVEPVVEQPAPATPPAPESPPDPKKKANVLSDLLDDVTKYVTQLHLTADEFDTMREAAGILDGQPIDDLEEEPLLSLVTLLKVEWAKRTRQS